MSYRINPDHYCTEDGCTRPRATGMDICTQCERLKRAVGQPFYTREETESEPDYCTEDGCDRPQIPGFNLCSQCASAKILDSDGEIKAPRCIAYLSMAGDVITLELTGEPKFTEADVNAVADLLSKRRKR